MNHPQRKSLPINKLRIGNLPQQAAINVSRESSIGSQPAKQGFNIEDVKVPVQSFSHRRPFDREQRVSLNDDEEEDGGNIAALMSQQIFPAVNTTYNTQHSGGSEIVMNEVAGKIGAQKQQFRAAGEQRPMSKMNTQNVAIGSQ